jgi:fibronectin type 3 domain-containing protein
VANNSAVGLVWEANTEEDISSYNVYRSTTAGVPGTKIGDGVTSLAFNDSNAVNGTTYYYTITAVDLIGNESLPSAEVAATPDPNAGQAPVGSGRETFSYPLGDLGGSTPPIGSGFAGSWVDESGATSVVSGSLTAPSGYGPAPSGNSIRRENDGYFTTSIGLAGENQLDFNAESVLYISYLFRYGGGSQGFLELLSGGTRIGVVGKLSNSMNLSAGLNASAANARALPLDTDMLIVARIETQTVGNDRISASFFTTSVGQEPQTWDVEFSGNVTDTLDTLRFYNAAVGTYVQYDELRLGSSFESVTAEPSTGPDAPQNVAQVSTDSAVTVSWDAVPGAVSYTLYRSTVSGDYSSPETVSGLTETNQIDDTVSNGTRYFYVVTAIDGDGAESAFSEEISALPFGFGNVAPAFAADPVVEFDATETVAYSATLADNAADGDGDTLYFTKLSGPGWLSIAENGALSGTPSPSDVGLNLFTVQVLAAGGSDTATLNIIVLSIPDTTAPAAPTGLVATAGNNFVSLDWADSLEADLGGYALYRSETSGSFGAPLEANLGTSDFVDSSAVNGTTYYYAVAAFDEVPNFSSLSSEVSATPLAPPPVTLSVAEPFAYTAGLLTNVAATGTGLVGNWSSRGTAHSVVDGSLSAPLGYGFTPAGGRLVYNSIWGGVKASLAPEAQINFNTDGVTYLSFLLNPGNSGGLFRLIFYSGSTEVGYVGDANLSSAKLEVKLSSAVGGGDLPANESVLVVAKIETSAIGTDTISASFFTETVGEEPATWSAVTSASGIALVDLIEFYGSGANGNTFQVDELRMGSTFGSVIGAAPISADNDEDGIDDTWETANFGNIGVIDGSGDADSDGLKDFIEYLFGSDPKVAANRGEPLHLAPSQDGSAMVFEWSVAAGLAEGVDYLVRYSTDLSTWDPLPEGDFTMTATPNGNLSEVELSLPQANFGPNVFIRLERPALH